MPTHTIRPATLDDLRALTNIYNHYVVNTTITFEVRPLTVNERRPWFDDHKAAGPHPLLVAIKDEGGCSAYPNPPASRLQRPT